MMKFKNKNRKKSFRAKKVINPDSWKKYHPLTLKVKWSVP